MSETTFREHMVDLAGLSFRYWERGPADGIPVVLLHALGRDADDWRSVAAAFGDQWRVIALDQRGHGKSARPGTYSFELMRDDVAAFLDALKLDDVVLIGHSMGGAVAYLFAESFPHRVRRMVPVRTG
jgi:pimeloyl-ACP methyl ester carboxylesterase